MKFTIQTGDYNTVVLTLSGDISIYQVDAFQKALRLIARRPESEKNIVIDLKEVGFIDPLSLGPITALARDARTEGGDVKFANVNETIRLLLCETYLSKTYELHNSVAEAIKSYKEA